MKKIVLGVTLFNSFMDLKYLSIVVIGLLTSINSCAQTKYGANVPWVTYEAEDMKTNGIVLGPEHEPHHVETESSGQKCVKLQASGQFVEFNAKVKANAMVIRYSIPDNRNGQGETATIDLFKNKHLISNYKLTSQFSWLYGRYPFTNDPQATNPRNFYNEIRIINLNIFKGDIIHIRFNNAHDDEATYCIIDLVDLEKVADPLKKPMNSFDFTDKAFANTVNSGDYTMALKKCIAEAAKFAKKVWIPAGNYKIAGDIVVPSGVTIQGSGMWYSTFVGDNNQYSDPSKRVRIIGNGNNIHLADFAVIGKLNYRSDLEANDGIVGSYGTNSSISRLWIEHTKVGIWIQNSENLDIIGCRLRNTMADGINFCVGVRHSTIRKCTARGTGDDCFAIWPAAFELQKFNPGFNIIDHCTAQLPFLANGLAIYGGESNTVEHFFSKDISQGSGILISTTFPTDNPGEGVNNNFKGTTIIRNCYVDHSGGFDHKWKWRGAIEICMDKKDISGLEMENINIKKSFSTALNIITKPDSRFTRNLSNAILRHINMDDYNISVSKGSAFYISDKVSGGVKIEASAIPTIENRSKSFTVKN